MVLSVIDVLTSCSVLDVVLRYKLYLTELLLLVDFLQVNITFLGPTTADNKTGVVGGTFGFVLNSLLIPLQIPLLSPACIL